MDFIGGIAGMNFTPVTNYNKVLKNNMSFDVNSSMDFENILNKQTMQLQNTSAIQGGVEMNNFDDLVAQQSVKSVDSDSPTSNFMNSFSQSLNGGLNSVNDSIKSAEAAQESLATGGDVSVHDVMIAAEKASLNLQMTMQLRNKLLGAYNEINNVRV